MRCADYIGDMTTWHLAICTDCTPVLPQPFTDPVKRDEWLTAHKQGTVHTVLLARQEDEEITLAPGQLYVGGGHGGWTHIGETASNVRIRTGGTAEFY